LWTVCDDSRDLIEGQNLVAGGDSDFLGACENVGLGCPAGEGPLHGCFVNVPCGQPLRGVHSGYPEQEQVRGDALRGLYRGGTAGHGRMFEQAPAEEEDADTRMPHERCGDRGAVRNDCARQGRREGPNNCQGCGAAVKDDGAAWIDEAGSAAGDPILAFRLNTGPGGVVCGRRGDGQGSAVHPLAQSGGGQFPKIAANAVIGQPKFGRDFLGDKLPVLSQPVEEKSVAFSSKHFMFLPGYARFCTIVVLMSPSLMILIAGPYRSGTDDDPELLRRNLARLEQAAWPIFRAGHLPMIGEWVALPVLESAGVVDLSDPLAGEVMYPTAERLLERCDAVLRLAGESRGADQDVAIARDRGIPVYYGLDEIPGVVPTPMDMTQ
jgi:hypothetical protein